MVEFQETRHRWVTLTANHLREILYCGQQQSDVFGAFDITSDAVNSLQLSDHVIIDAKDAKGSYAANKFRQAVDVVRGHVSDEGDDSRNVELAVECGVNEATTGGVIWADGRHGILLSGRLVGFLLALFVFLKLTNPNVQFRGV